MSVAWELPDARDHHDVDEGDVDINGVESVVDVLGCRANSRELLSARDRHDVDEGAVDIDGVKVPSRGSSRTFTITMILAKLRVR